jgi:hypothetical protein
VQCCEGGKGSVFQRDLLLNFTLNIPLPQLSPSLSSPRRPMCVPCLSGYMYSNIRECMQAIWCLPPRSRMWGAARERRESASRDGRPVLLAQHAEAGGRAAKEPAAAAATATEASTIE